jgi:hypothetical protein
MKIIRHLGPLLLGFVSILFYYFYYGFSIDIHSSDFVTALMVFFAAVGWCGIILYSQEKQPVMLFIYSILGNGGPIVMYFFFPGFDRLWHSIAFGLFLIAFIGLRFFTVAHVRYQLKKRGES